jgi:hypothetical protein
MGSARITCDLNLEELAAQAENYFEGGTKWRNKIFQLLMTSERSHPLFPVRVHELLKWDKSEEYQRLRAALSGDASIFSRDDSRPCAHCGHSIKTQHKFCHYCGETQ